MQLSRVALRHPQQILRPLSPGVCTILDRVDQLCARQNRAAIGRARAERLSVSFLCAGRDAILSAQSGGNQIRAEKLFHPGGCVVRANQKAAELAPVIAELRAAGITSKKGTAKALNDRAIPTPRGVGEWRAIQVARVLARLEVKGDGGASTPFFGCFLPNTLLHCLRRGNPCSSSLTASVTTSIAH
jgi:hypothetical protein